jgi:acyl-CoA synthetase (AMP-forming)/AMP-acid ligase II
MPAEISWLGRQRFGSIGGHQFAGMGRALMRLHDYLEFFARENPDHPFADMNGASISYAQANERANRMAHGYLASGLEKGDRISYLSKNSIDMAIMFFAASKAGVVPVPLNYRLAPREWLYIINDAQSRTLFCSGEYVDGIDSVRDKLNQVNAFVCTTGTADGWTDNESWLSKETANPGLDISENDQLYQMYTSGTTGHPKGAMLSHRAIDCNTRMISSVMTLPVGSARILIVAPMYHAAAGISIMNGISNGATLVIHEDFHPGHVIQALSDGGITSATLVPAMIQACLVSVPDAGERAYPSLEYMAYGASPIAEETLRQAMAVFKCNFAQVFGMTETTAMATVLGPAEHRRALAGEPALLKSAGRAALGTEVKIVDEEDREVDRGTIGEVIVRGPQVMMGYWNLPEATEKSLKDGWMHTGDAAYMDDEGFIYIQDRIKDMIVSGGENIYPTEIENALFEHDAVADAAVIGIPSEQWGESVLAFLVLKDGQTVTPEDKIPRRIEFLDAIPRNASGKILKKDLREPFWEGVERRVS